MDVDLLIMSVQFKCKNYVKVKIRYAARGKDYFYDKGPSSVKIYQKDFYNWSLVNPRSET